MLTHLRHKGRTDRIVSGYIREQYTRHIPVEIVKICELFYKEIFHCTFDEKSMDKIRKIKNKEKVFGIGRINVRGYEFKGFIKHTRDGYWFCIYTEDKLPKNYDFEIMYEVYCDELRTSHTFTISAKSDQIWPIHTSDDWGEATDWTLFKEATNIKQLSFTIYLDFMYMTYMTNQIDIYHPVKLSKKIDYKWHIDRDLREKFKNAVKGEKFHSDYFGCNEEKDIMKQYAFCLELEFEPRHFISLKRYRLRLRPVSLPKGIRIECDVKLNGRIKREDCFYGPSGCNFVIDEDDELQNMLGELDEFSVEIEIKRVKTGLFPNNNLVANENWNKYGIE